jgi:hypothetical protein
VQIRSQGTECGRGREAQFKDERVFQCSENGRPETCAYSSPCDPLDACNIEGFVLACLYSFRSAVIRFVRLKCL